MVRESALPDYARASTRLTLRAGLSEYFAVHAGLVREESLSSDEARRFFRSHDAVHVVWGCGTSMMDEAVVKLASLWGTTGGVRVLRGYMLYESLDIYRKLPLRGTLLAIAAAPWLIARTLLGCIRQADRWPWDAYEAYLDVPLAETRARFGIRIAHAP